MKARTLGLLALAAAGGAAAAFAYRRHGAVSEPLVQLGLADGSSLALEPGEPGVVELQGLAADLRRSLEAGG